MTTLRIESYAQSSIRNCLYSMNIFSKISLLLTASGALFLPACGGGGGDNQDYYVSVQGFRTGSKGFYISSSPSAEIFADPGGINGKWYSLSEGFTSLVGLGTNSDVAYENDPRTGDDGGVYTRGSVNVVNGDENVADVGYYTSGGSSGQGFLYVSFQGEPSDDIAHFMGASNPTDVKVAGLGGNTTSFWVVQDVSQLLLVSLNGATMKIVLDFSSGIAQVRLVVAAIEDTYELLPGQGNMNGDHVSQGGNIYGVGGAASDQVLATRTTAFFAVDR